MEHLEIPVQALTVAQVRNRIPVLVQCRVTAVPALMEAAPRQIRVRELTAASLAAELNNRAPPGRTANQNPGSEGYVQVAEDGSWTATEPDGEIVRVYPDGSWDRSNPATGNTDWVGADGSWITNENGLPNGSNKNSQVQPNGTYEVRMNGEASHETPSGTPETPVMPNGSNAVTPKGAVQPAKR